METKVVHCKKSEYDVLIDRTTMWGNSFRIGTDGNRNEVIQKYGQWLHGSHYTDFKQKERQAILDDVHTLRGKTLGCWCKPTKCHGDFLALLADGVICL